jgi:hypothetical protein
MHPRDARPVIQRPVMKRTAALGAANKAARQDRLECTNRTLRTVPRVPSDDLQHGPLRKGTDASEIPVYPALRPRHTHFGTRCSGRPIAAIERRHSLSV